MKTKTKIFVMEIFGIW